MPFPLRFIPLLLISTAAVFAAAVPGPKDLPVHPEMPDPLVAKDGTPITTPDQWAKRRVEMKQILEDYEFGHMPPPPGNVTGKLTSSQIIQSGSATLTWRQVHLSFGPDQKLGFDLSIFSPALEHLQATAGAPPTIIHLTYRTGTNSLAPYAEAFSRGYAVAQIDYKQLGADAPNFRQTGFFPAYPGYDWNDFAAWAWGVSRAVDYLVSDPATAKSMLIVTGVSRLAQSAELAGAFDERIALVAGVGCGCAFRFTGHGRGGKQGLDEVIDQNTYWFGPNLPQFYGQTDKLPFDQHWMVALTAPRRFILCNGLDDQYVNGNGVAQSYLAAKPTFAMLGVADHLAQNFRPGRHGFEAADWLAILDFADQQLRGQKIDRKFDQLPAADLLH
jgi:hypothetical protein